MKFFLVDEDNRVIGPPPVSDEELGQILRQTDEDMQSIHLSPDEMTRCLSVLENLVGTTGLLLSGKPWGRLSSAQAADLNRRLKELSNDAMERIESDPEIKDLVVQLRFLTTQAANRNLVLWLDAEDQ